MDTEENGGKERRNLARDLLGHAGSYTMDCSRRESPKLVQNVQVCSQHRAMPCTQDSVDSGTIMEEPT